MPSLGLPELLIILVILFVLILIPAVIAGGVIAVVLMVSRKKDKDNDGQAKMVSQDLEHLRLLSIFFYVMAALSVMSVCLMGVQVAAVFVSLIGPGGPTGGPSFDAPIAIFFAIVFIIVLLYTIGSFLTGRYLSQKEHYQFCMVVAGISCLSMPLGTILGVFTILVLLRPSVKTLFYGE